MTDSILFHLRKRGTLLFTALFFGASLACAGSPEARKGGAAMAGYDPVAYFTQNKAARGDARYTADYAGATWNFASAKHRELFAANPAKYAPQYGGHCAWAMAAKNELYPTDPNVFAIVNGKLYLNYNKDVAGMWNKDRAGYIKKANRNWAQSDQPISMNVNQ